MYKLIHFWHLHTAQFFFWLNLQLRQIKELRLKFCQNKKGQTFVESYFWSAACPPKKRIKKRASQQIFGPSYFDTKSNGCLFIILSRKECKVTVCFEARMYRKIRKFSRYSSTYVFSFFFSFFQFSYKLTVLVIFSYSIK